MTPLEVKYYLSRGYWIRKNIETKRSRIARLRELASSATASTTAARVGGTPDRSRVETYIGMAVDLEREMQEDLTQLLATEREIQSVFRALDDPRAQAILEDYHLSGLTLEEISAKYKKSVVHIWRIRKESYKIIAEKFSECNGM